MSRTSKSLAPRPCGCSTRSISHIVRGVHRQDVPPLVRQLCTGLVRCHEPHVNAYGMKTDGIGAGALPAMTWFSHR